VRLLLFLLLVIVSRVACAQAARPWPRNAAGKIEFTGRLPWPDSVRTEAQRQLLVRRWYRRKLTNDKLTAIRTFIRESGATYSGIPQESCYLLNIANDDKEHFSLCFHITLTPDEGLTYRFFDFESRYGSIDYSTNDALENTLALKNCNMQSIMESFHEQLVAATKGW